MRRYSATAGVALVGASVIAGTPVASAAAASPSEIRIVRSEVGLAAASSLLNVPINLITDIINIPYNEVQAVDYLSRSLIFSGPWFVVSATNIWGVDPGDPGHFMSTVNLLVPFPALSGLGLDQSDQTGLGQQLWHFVAAELPVNKFCDADGCPPAVPISPITGITSVDQTLWGLALTFGLYGFAPGASVKFPLYNNWFAVPISDLVSGYTFGPDQPGYTDPSGPVYPGFGFAGTTEVDGPNGPEYLMPWADTTFKLDLSKPFQNYFDHLMADPATNPIHLPSLVEIGRTIQTLAAALVIAFDPLTPGSGLCTGGLGNCSWLPPALDYPGIVKFIGDLWPGNPVINEWLVARANGIANVPTEEQIETAQRLANQNGSFWDFGNPPVPSELISGSNPSTLAPFFHQLWTNLGLNPPPLAPPVEPEEGTSSVNALTGGPETQLKAKVIEKDPLNTIASALGFNGEGTPPGESGAATLPADPAGTTLPADPAGTNPPAQDGGLTPPTGLNDTVRKPGFVPRLVNRFLPHPSGANSTSTGTTTGTEKTTTGSEKTGSGSEKTGSGSEKTGSGSEKTGSGSEKTGSGSEKTGSGSGTSTGAHSGSGSAA